MPLLFVLLLAPPGFGQAYAKDPDGVGSRIDALIRESKLDEALQLADVMEASAANTHGVTHKTYADALHRKAVLNLAQSRFTAAAPLLKRAIEIYRMRPVDGSKLAAAMTALAMPGCGSEGRAGVDLTPTGAWVTLRPGVPSCETGPQCRKRSV